MTYKLIQECGLEVVSANYHNEGITSSIPFVKASDLEAFLSKAVRVYNPSEQDATWITAKGDWCSREALLINIREIPKLEPVSKEELLKFIKEKTHRFESDARAFIERIEKAGIR
jgi:hypothetical protein